MNIDSAIIEKIRKMLALADDSGAHPGEVENAMAKAKEIAMRHSIDIASISLNVDEKKKKADVTVNETLKTRSKYEQPYHNSIYCVLESVFGVKVIRRVYRDRSGGTIVTGLVLIGDPTDVGIAIAIFPWLQKVFPKTLSTLVKEGKGIGISLRPIGLLLKES